MIIIYNLSGLLLAVAGVFVGLLVFLVSGWIGPGLLTIALIWFAGGLWWRNQEISPGVKRPFPAVYFIPLPFLAVPVAGLAVLMFVVDVGARLQPANRRAEVNPADRPAVAARDALAGNRLRRNPNLPANVPAQGADSSEIRYDAEAGAKELPNQVASRDAGPEQESPETERADDDSPRRDEAVTANDSPPEGPSETVPELDPDADSRPEPEMTPEPEATPKDEAPTGAPKKVAPAEKSQPAAKDRARPAERPKKGMGESTANRGTKTANAPRVRKDAGPASKRSPAASAGNAAENRKAMTMSWGVTSLAFSPTGGWLAAGRLDQALTLFDAKKEVRLESVEMLQQLGSVTSCLFTPDGSHLLAGGTLGRVQIYDVSRAGRLKPGAQFAGNSHEVTCLAISGDGRWAISGGKEKALRYWDVDTGQEQAAFPGWDGPIKACWIDQSGHTALATDGATLQEIDLQKKDVTRRQQLGRSWAAGQAAALSADGDLVAVGDGYNVRLWDLKSQSERPKLEDSEIQWSMVFTPDGTRLITGGHGKVNVWDVRQGRKLETLPVADHGYIKSLAVTADNQRVAAIPSSAGQELKIFRLGKAD